MTYYRDTNSSFSLNRVDQVHWIPMHTSNLSGAKEYPLWTKLDVINKTDRSVSLFFKNPRAGMDEVDVYVFRAHSVEIHRLGDNRPLTWREIPNTHSVFMVALTPGEKVKIITRLVNRIGSIEGEWEIYSKKSYYSSLFSSTLWWGTFAGILIALTLYALPIIVAAKDTKMAFLFSMYIVASLSYQFSVNGFFYFVGVSPQWINFSVLFSAISFGFFGLLFIVRYLLLEKYRGIVLSTIVFFIALLFLEYCLLFIGLFNKEVMSFLGHFNVYVGLVAYIVWFAMLRQIMLISHDKVFKYLFTGYTIVILAYALQALVVAGVLKMSIVSIYGVSVATVVEIVFFVLGIKEYIHQLHIEQKRKDKLIDSQMQFASIGKVIGNIVHQWRVPLVRADSLVTQMDSFLHFDPDSLKRELQKNLPKLRKNLRFMHETVDEFYNLYSTKPQCKYFNIVQTLQDVWDMLGAKVLRLDAKMVIDTVEKEEIFSYPHAFSHVILIILDNALSVAEMRKKDFVVIKVGIISSGNKIRVNIEDNCGGIEQNPIHSIFEIDVSSKKNDQEEGGLGLPMAKLIVEERLNGFIHVQNSMDGALFQIEFYNL